MSDIKTKLQEIKEKVANPNISLLEIWNLQNEWHKIVAPISQDATKKEERMLANEIISESINPAIFNHIDKWGRGEIDPKDEEVAFLHGWWIEHKKFGANWAAFEKAVNELKHIDEEEKRQNIKLLKEAIEKLKSRELMLIKLFQNWKEKHQHEEENSDISSETSSEEASSRSTTTDTDKRNKKDKKFPGWGIALIVIGVLVIAGVIGYFVLEKKERPKPKKTKSK